MTVWMRMWLTKHAQSVDEKYVSQFTNVRTLEQFPECRGKRGAVFTTWLIDKARDEKKRSSTRYCNDRCDIFISIQLSSSC